MKGLIKMKKLMLILMCAATITSVAACGVKEPVTARGNKSSNRNQNSRRTRNGW